MAGQSEKTNEAGNTNSSRARWLIVGGACALLAVGGVSMVWGGWESAEEEEEPVQEEEAFQPFSGGSVSDSEAAALFGDDEEEGDDGPSFADIEDDLPGEEVRGRSDGGEARNIAEMEIDGERVIRDSRGNAITRSRAEERLEESINSLDEIEDDHIRRLRRRDMLTTSRVIRPSAQGAEIAGDIQVSEEVRNRIHQEFEVYAQSEEFEGVSEEDYEGVAERRQTADEDDGWDDEYDDYYDEWDDEYYGDEDYWDEEYDDEEDW